jgi:hypothetical protein
MEGCDYCDDAFTCNACSYGWEFIGTDSTCGEIDSTCYGDSHWDATMYYCECNNPQTYYDSTPS